jgi:hypothetical protein
MVGGGMNLSDVMDEIAARLGAIKGLRVFAYPADSLSPPAAAVLYPDGITFDETYGRGMDRLTLPVLLVVGKPTDRSTRDRIAQYCDGSGPASVKAAVEAGDGAAFDTVRVTGVEFPTATIGGTEYMAAMFDLDIAGQGA